MAHSNRQKLRDARGGKTRHQDAKQGGGSRYRSTFDAQARMLEISKWQEDRETKAAGPKTEMRKRRSYSMKLSAQARRLRAFDRHAAAQVQQCKDALPLDPRVTQEMKVLNERFVGLPQA